MSLDQILRESIETTLLEQLQAHDPAVRDKLFIKQALLQQGDIETGAADSPDHVSVVHHHKVLATISTIPGILVWILIATALAYTLLANVYHEIKASEK